MPYIKTSDRPAKHPLTFSGKSKEVATTAGELNYQFTMLLKAYMEKKGLSYQTLNDIEGALSCCSKEFYDRVVRPYERKKRKENGDVW
jgi:hypothetical protein